MATIDMPYTDVLEPGYLAGHFQRMRQTPNAIATPLPTWNALCRDEGGGIGLALGWYVVIAGATGHGKSLLALNLAARAMQDRRADGDGRNIGFIALEMSEAQVTNRLLSIVSDVAVEGLEPGARHAPLAEEAARDAVGKLRDETRASVFCSDVVFEVSEIVELAEYWVKDLDVELVVVDYLQLVGARHSDSDYRRISEVSARLRQLAKRQKVVVVALSQLNRQTSANRWESPIPQGLIGSSSIENDADQVILLDHARYTREQATAKTFAILGKNRHGGAGEIPIEWDYSTLRVREALPDEEHEWPDYANRSS